MSWGHEVCAHAMNAWRALGSRPASRMSCPRLWASRHSSFDDAHASLSPRSAPFTKTAAKTVQATPVVATHRFALAFPFITSLPRSSRSLSNAARLEDLLRSFEVEGRIAVHLRRRGARRSEEHTSELQSLRHLVC